MSQLLKDKAIDCLSWEWIKPELFEILDMFFDNNNNLKEGINQDAYSEILECIDVSYIEFERLSEEIRKEVEGE